LSLSDNPHDTGTSGGGSLVDKLLRSLRAGGMPVVADQSVGLLGFDSDEGQPLSVAASSIIIAKRFLASSNCRLVISAILRSR